MILRWDVSGPYAVVFSTRQGGVSEGPFESLNLGKAVGDEPERRTDGGCVPRCVPIPTC